MSYTKNYIIDLTNLELELDFLMDNYDPDDTERVLELQAQIANMKDVLPFH
tara:strand:- start:758 stop:910 length:153 start_codon:yes stop_codon:yes gene_type:complete